MDEQIPSNKTQAQKEAYNRWKKGQVMQEEYRDAECAGVRLGKPKPIGS